MNIQFDFKISLDIDNNFHDSTLRFLCNILNLKEQFYKEEYREMENFCI